MIRAKVESTMRHAQKLIKAGHEVIPHFRVMTYDSDYMVFVPLPDDVEVRVARFDLVRRFMVWKMATGFIFTTETVEPDALTSMALWRDKQTCKLQGEGFWCAITRKPKISFGAYEPMTTEQAGDMLGMLPQSEEQLTREEIQELETLMSEDGAFCVQAL